MAIFKEALNPFGKAFGDMSASGKNNPYANSIMFNAMGNRLAEGRQLAAANNLSYGGVDDNGEHIFAPAGVYQPMQEAAEGILGLLDSRPLPPDMGLMQPEGPIIFPPIHGDPLPPEMLPIPPIDPNLEMIGGPLPGPPSLPNFDFDYPDPNPPANSQVTDPYFQQPIFELDVAETDDPFQYAQPEYAQPDTRSPIVQEKPPIFYEDPIIPDPPKVVQGGAPGPGYIEDPVAVGAPIATATPISQPIDTGPNPFYVGATNVAQPPSMTPVAPSFSLDVGMGGYGTPTNTAGFNNYDFGNIGAGVYGGFNLPSTLTPPQTTTTPATGVAPQTTTTPLPTVNSFAGFNGFGGFGGF